MGCPGMLAIIPLAALEKLVCPCNHRSGRRWCGEDLQVGGQVYGEACTQAGCWEVLAASQVSDCGAALGGYK